MHCRVGYNLQGYNVCNTILTITCNQIDVTQRLARFQAKLVLGQAAANVKIRGRILFAVRGCETILFCT